jgi:hypothetical protein
MEGPLHASARGLTAGSTDPRRMDLPSVPAVPRLAPVRPPPRSPVAAAGPAQDRGEHGGRSRDLGGLKDQAAPVAHDAGADLHEPLAQRAQRPVRNLVRQDEQAQTVGQVVGARDRLELDRVARELRQDSRVQRSARFPYLVQCSAVPRPSGAPPTRSAGPVRLATRDPTRVHSSPWCHSTLAATRRRLVQLRAW